MINHSLLTRLRTQIWEDHSNPSRIHAGSIQFARYTVALLRDLLDGQLSMRSMSLVYTTLLSLVPFLALGFSVLKALGVHNTLEPVLQEFLRPLGPQAAEVTGNLIGFVEKIQVGVLGSLGVALLFYTAISLIQKVESSFNYIWRIERARPFAQRVGEYLGVLMVGPVIVFSALGMTASVLNSGLIAEIKSVEPLGFLLYGFTRLIPYAMIVGMFTFLYAYIPNTKVNIRSAAIGGAAAGVLWQTASFAFASFVAGATNYNAIYSSFAIVIFLLIWLYLGWLILLIGCQLAFYTQHPSHLKPVRSLVPVGCREAEYVALFVMRIVAQRFLLGRPALTQEEVARETGAATDDVSNAVTTLITQGLLIEAGQARTQLIPARDLDSISVGEVWRKIRQGATTESIKKNGSGGRDIERMIDAVEQEFIDGNGRQSLRAWLASGPSLAPTAVGAN